MTAEPDGRRPRRYVTVDVFTDRPFGGNPLAVVLEAEGLDAAAMQAIAAEFNYAETTFVLPPADRRHDATVRIYTPRREMPFAGHPNVGTAYVLAQERARAGAAVPAELVFEEHAGLVPMRVLVEHGTTVGAELTAPAPLAVGPPVDVAVAAACLGLPAAAVRTASHPPRVLSVGFALLVVELASREALAAASGPLAEHARHLPALGTDAVYAYVRAPGAATLRTRMFAPLDGVPEDPATGSAAAATVAYLAELARLDGGGDARREWVLEQGIELGRSSVIRGTTLVVDGAPVVRVGGRVVRMMEGLLLA